MRLEPGTRLGPYQILSPLGAGGMGEVYRARDTRLGRDVAVKVLPEHLSSTEDHARFLREAKAISRFNHPNICVLHDIGSQAGVSYLVMELVDGETLSQRLARGALPITEALEIGSRVANALDRAHRAGIVHRDLKPGNIMLTKSGPKLMDFGLARQAQNAPQEPDILSATAAAASNEPITARGVVVGTVEYMAPEQLEGKPADARSDIWALGCVLYEMITGNRAFRGRSQASLIAAIMNQEPEPLLPFAPLAPAELDHLVRTCLAKDPDARFQSSHDVGLQLTWMRRAWSMERPVPGRFRSWRAALGPALLLAVAALIGGYWAGHRSARSVAEAPLHSIVPLPDSTLLAGWSSPCLAISPDGKTLAYVATAADDARRLYVRRLDREQTVVVPGSEEAEGPMFSPKGDEVAFAVGVSIGRRPGELLKYSLASGLTRSLCKLGDYYGGEWLRDGSILLVEEITGGLWRVSGEGGPLKPVVCKFKVNGQEMERRFKWPQMLPDQSHVLGISTGHVVIVDLASGKLADTGVEATYARYTPTGHLLYASPDSMLMAVPFQAARGVAVGPALGLMRDISFTENGAMALAFSSNGTLVYCEGPVRGTGNDPRRLVRFDWTGQIHPLPFKPAPMERIAIAPDGVRLAVISGSELWIYDLRRNTRMKLPEDNVTDRLYVAWLPDGRSVAFTGLQDGWPSYDLFVQPTDGRSGPTRVGGTPLEDQAGSVTPDGRHLLFATFDSQVDGKSAVWEIPLGSRGTPQRVTSGLQHDSFPRISPDGTVLAYTGVESDRQVFLNTYPDLGTPVQVTPNGSDTPRWLPGGREFVFRSGGKLNRVTVERAPTLRVGEPQPLFALAGITTFEVLPDGSGLIAVQTVEDAGKQTQLHLVANWFGELKAVVASRGGN